MDEIDKSQNLEEIWRKHIGRFNKSKLARSKYCIKHGLKAHQLSYWLRRIKQIDMKSRKIKVKPAFSKVVEKTPNPKKSELITLILPTGIQIKFEPFSDIDWAAKLILKLANQ